MKEPSKEQIRADALDLAAMLDDEGKRAKPANWADTTPIAFAGRPHDAGAELDKRFNEFGACVIESVSTGRHRVLATAESTAEVAVALRRMGRSADEPKRLAKQTTRPNRTGKRLTGDGMRYCIPYEPKPTKTFPKRSRADRYAVECYRDRFDAPWTVSACRSVIVRGRAKNATKGSIDASVFADVIDRCTTDYEDALAAGRTSPALFAAIVYSERHTHPLVLCVPRDSGTHAAGDDSTLPFQPFYIRADFIDYVEGAFEGVYWSAVYVNCDSPRLYALADNEIVAICVPLHDERANVYDEDWFTINVPENFRPRALALVDDALEGTTEVIKVE